MPRFPWGWVLGINPLCFRLLRSEEHTSELQSPCNLVCRLLLEKKKLRVADFMVGAQLLDARPIQHIRAQLVAPTDVGFSVFQHLLFFISFFFLIFGQPRIYPLFPYTTLSG